MTDNTPTRPVIEAPWTTAQVTALNRWQQSPHVHPFTCGRRSDPGHDWHGEHDLGILVATPEGWICRDCDYMQFWAHLQMLTEPVDPMTDHTLTVRDHSGRCDHGYFGSHVWREPGASWQTCDGGREIVLRKARAKIPVAAEPWDVIPYDDVWVEEPKKRILVPEALGVEHD